MATTTMDGAGSRGLPRWMWWIMVFGVMLLVFYGAWRIGLKRAISRELAAIKAAGYPTTPGEMQAWYPPIPAGEPNAAEELAAGMARMKQPKDVFGEELTDARPWIAAGLESGATTAGGGPVMKPRADLIPLMGGITRPAADKAYPAQCMALVQAYVAANEAAMEKLEAAAKIEPSRYPADYSRGWNVLLPGLSGIRVACNLFGLAAIDAEREQDSERAARAILGQLGIARSMRNEPVIVTQLVRDACVALSVGSLERAMSRMSFDAEQIARVEHALAESESGSGGRGMWAGECAAFQDAFAHPQIMASMMGSSPPSKAAGAFYSVSGINDYCRLRYLRMMRRHREISGLAEENQWDEAQRMEAEIEAEIRSRGWMMRPLAVMMPSLSRVFLIELRMTAVERCARGALAAERFRLARGQWPTNWGELAPGYLEKEPVDPFTGKALKMKVADGVLTVYSVGEDLADNGGARLNGDGRMFGPGSDVVFEIRQPPAVSPKAS
ncbi:MAG: hypothetical protein ACYC26_16940 [Phycisphaerales bacterium]